MSRWGATGLMLAFAAAACSDKNKQPGLDSELAHDIALANQTPAVPQFNDVPLGTLPKTRPVEPSPAPRRESATRRVRPAPQPTPRVPRRESPTRTAQSSAPVTATPTPTPAPAMRGFQRGTSFGLITKSPVCTSNLPGDKLTAQVTEPVRGDNGAYMPQGTTVVLEVATVTPGDSPESAQLTLRVRSILLNDEPTSMEGDVSVLSPLETHKVPGDKNSDARKVVGGAVAGAILGQIFGRDTRSTVIGAAAGAAAGTAAAMGSRKYDACLPAGASLRVTTSQPITLSA